MSRRGHVAGGLAALVLLLVLVGLVPLLRSHDRVATTPLSADDYYAVAGGLTCHSEVKEVPTLPLDARPVALLICADPDSSQPWTAPADLVNGDLTGLVSELSDLERAPAEPYDCTFQGGTAYDLVLRFSRDRYARIHGDVGGCGVVTTASGEWFGARGVLDAALGLVEDQRNRSDPPTAVPARDLSCSHVLTGAGSAISLTGKTADLVRMVSCWQPDAAELGAWSEAAVRPSDVRIIARDITRLASTSADPTDLRCPGGLRKHYFQQLIAETAWGDVLVVAGECRRFYASLPSDELAPVWHPSPRAQRILDDLRR